MLDTTYSQLRKFGRAVRNARHELALSQEDFAERCDLHRNYVGAIERGEVNVSWESIAKLCRGLRVKQSALLLRAGL